MMKDGTLRLYTDGTCTVIAYSPVEAGSASTPRGRSEKDSAMGDPHRIQRSRAKGSTTPPNTVYVGRPSKWGNPYCVDGYNIRDENDEPAAKDVQLREGRIMAHRDYEAALYCDQLPYKLDDVRRELRGKNLSCWCPLDGPCHADVLLEVANSEVTDFELIYAELAPKLASRGTAKNEREGQRRD